MNGDHHSSESEALGQHVNDSNHLSPQIPPLVIKKKRKSNAELAAEAVANERDIVRNLKRLSIGGASASFDPELAHGESSFENFVNKQNQKRSSLASAGGKRKSSQLSPLDFQLFDYSTAYSTSPTSSTHPSLPALSSTNSLVSNNLVEDSVLLLNHSTSISRRSSSRNYSLRNKNSLSASSSVNNESVIDASKLLWVPATSHPGIAPENFRKHVQSTITEITQNLSCEENADTNNDLPQLAIDQSGISTSPNNEYDNNNIPSLLDLTTELERLSTMAGLEATDAATLARTLSTSSILSFLNVNVGLSHSSTGLPLSRDSSINSSHDPNELSQQHIQNLPGSLNNSSSSFKGPEEENVNSNETTTNANIELNDKSKPISLPGGDIKLRRSRWTTYRKRGNTIKRKQQSPPPLPSSSTSQQSTTDSSLTENAAEKENLLNRRKRSQDLSKHPLPKLSAKLQELNKNNIVNSKDVDVGENPSSIDSSVSKTNAEQNTHDIDNNTNISERSKSDVSHSMNISSPVSNMGSPSRSIPTTPSTVSSSTAGSPIGSPSSNLAGSQMSSKATIMNHRREERERLKQERRKLEIQRLELEKEQKRLDDIRKERLQKGNRAQHRRHITNGSPRYYEKSSTSAKVEGADNSKIAEYPKSRRKYTESLDPKASSSPGAMSSDISSSPSPVDSSNPPKGIGINISPYSNNNGKESAQKYQQHSQSPHHQLQYANQNHNHHQQGYNQQQKYQQKSYSTNNHKNKMQQQYVDAEKSYVHHGRQGEYQHNVVQNRNNSNSIRMENRREDMFDGERTPQQTQQYPPHSNNMSNNSPDSAYQRGDAKNDIYLKDNRFRSTDNQSDISMSSKDASPRRGTISVTAQTPPGSSSLNTRSQSFSEGINSGAEIGIGVNDLLSGKTHGLNRSSSERFSERQDLQLNGEMTVTNESNNDNGERPKFFRNMSFDRSQSSSIAADSPTSHISEKFSKDKKERPGLVNNNLSLNSVPKVKKNTFWSRAKNNNKDTDNLASLASNGDKLNSENDSDGDNNNNYSKDNADLSSFTTQDSDQETYNSSASISTTATSAPESKKEKKMFGLFKRKSFKNLKLGTNKETDMKDQQKQQPNLPSNSKEQISCAEKLDQNESGSLSSGGFNSTMDVPSIDGKFGKDAAKSGANDYANNESIFITDEEYNNNNNIIVKSFEGSPNTQNNIAAAPNLNKGRFSVEQSQLRDPSQKFDNNLGTINEPAIELAEDGSNKMEVLSWLISAEHLNTLEKLQLFKQIQGSENSKPNQPVQYTDSAFGFPLPPLTHSTIIMLDHRFPMNVERAIYRLSHLKLANPKRELRQQVLLSNFMYAYLNLVNHTLLLQNMEEGAAGVGGATEGNNDNMTEMDMSQAEASAIEL